MKKIHLILPFACLWAYASAQEKTSGKIMYDEKIKLEIKIDDAHAEMLAGIPKERILGKELIFTTKSTIYQNDKSNVAETDVNQETENGEHIMIKMNQPDEKVFCDLENGRLIEQRDFMSRKFLIETDIDRQKWKLTGNQKMILDYRCQEAVLIDTAKKVVVWFTPSISISSGPNGYANLPGMVLAADIDNGKRTIIAKKVEWGEVDQSTLVKPHEGKKVTKEEFHKIVDEKMKEMQMENGGSGGNIIIKVRN